MTATRTVIVEWTYDPNQPRDPRGVETGGQWTEDPVPIDQQVPAGSVTSTTAPGTVPGTVPVKNDEVTSVAQSRVNSDLTARRVTEARAFFGRKFGEDNADTILSTVNKELALFIDASDVHIVTDAQTIERLMYGDRYTNGYKYGRTSFGQDASKYFDNRRNAENESFQYTKDTQDTDRPSYGAISPDITSHPELKMYGDAFVTFKSSVHDRTTITFGDSLNAYNDRSPIAGQPFRGYDPSSLVAAVRGGQLYWGATNTNDLTQIFNRYSGHTYVEAQIHGGFAFSDIAAVHFTKKVKKSLIDNLVGAGISVTTPQSRRGTQ